MRPPSWSWGESWYQCRLAFFPLNPHRPLAETARNRKAHHSDRSRARPHSPYTDTHRAVWSAAVSQPSRFDIACAELTTRYGLLLGLFCGCSCCSSRSRTSVVALRQNTYHPDLHRFFQRATWLWAAIFLLLTAALAVLMVTEPTNVFLLLTTAITVALVVAGTGASALWFLSVLRRLGLRLCFAQPEPGSWAR